MSCRIARLLLAALLVLPGGIHAAQPEGGARAGALHETLARMDQRLFHAAFVACDAERFRALFTEDAEFYHDLVGPTYGRDVWTLKGCPRDNGVRRVLVRDSLEVYPMHDFGAVQTGEHWFVEDGAATSTRARFVHLWRLDGGEWRLARVLSFDHRSRPRSEAPGGSAASGTAGEDGSAD